MAHKRKSKKEKTNKWLGLLILILIIGPIIGMFYFLSIGLGGIAGSMFGLYFLILGIIFIINSHEEYSKIVESIIILVGLIIIAVGIVNQFGPNQIVEFINSIGITLLFLLFCTVIGIGMIIGPRMYERSALKRCKKLVIAECVNMEDYIKGGWGPEIIQCSPIWQYTVNKEKYTYCNGIYDNIASEDYEEYRKQMIGATCELFVNSKNPQDVFVKIPADFEKRLTILGVGFLVSIGITIYFLFIGK